MRILYSHRTLSADGQYVHIRCLTEALRARGHAVLVAGPEGVHAGGAARRLDPGGPEGRGLRAWLPKPGYELAERLYSVSASFQLRRAARSFAPDILYERYNLFHHAGAGLARAHKLPLMLEVNAPLAEERQRHGGLALRRLAERSERRIWASADAVLPVTAVLARQIEAAGVSPQRITVIHNGVEPAFLEPQDRDAVRARLGLAGLTVLGFTGFVRAWHGLDRVLRFLAAHQEQALHFLVVGDGPARASLEAAALAAGIADRMTITGVVQRAAAPALASAFDIALQPAVVAYASPLKLFEYMALGHAIAAPASDNIREILQDGDNALLFDPDSEGAFEAALRALVDSAPLRRRIGAKARADLVRADYTWSGNAARVETIAQRLLEGRP